MAARTPTRLFSQGIGAGLRAALYVVPNVTASDTADVGSTGLNDFTKCYLILGVPLTNSALAVSTYTNATNFTMNTTGLTGEAVLVLVVGAST